MQTASQSLVPSDSKATASPDPVRLFDERNHFFTGKYMTARDFRDEQAYFLSHHRWHQWNLHGWGIVWGLNVRVEQEGCITICRGIAIDCYGRELVLPYAVRFSLDDVWERPDGQDDLPPQGLLLGLKFATRNRELVPLLISDDCDGGRAASHNRIQEYARICTSPHCEKCWSFPPLNQPQPAPAESPDTGDDGAAVSVQQHHDQDNCGCPPRAIRLRPTCSCGESGFVPLARLWRDDDQQLRADDLKRRYVQSPFYGEALTHIVGINWKHGEDTSSERFCPDCEQEATVTITFDRALEETCPSRLGQLVKLNYNIVRPDPDGDDRVEPINPSGVALSDDRRELHCKFPAGHLCRLALKLQVRVRMWLFCDMLIDERGRAVDGEHLGGSVPYLTACPPSDHAHKYRSGDGREGGLFYSWTTLTPDKVAH